MSLQFGSTHRDPWIEHRCPFGGFSFDPFSLPDLRLRVVTPVFSFFPSVPPRDGSRQEGRSLSGWLNPASRHGGEKFSLEVLDECCIERKSTLTRRSTCWILALPY